MVMLKLFFCLVVAVVYMSFEAGVEAQLPLSRTPRATQATVIAEGSHSSISKPFISLIRDLETYEVLRESDNQLIQLDDGFFKSNCVVAAFLGERPTGGYSISIVEQGDDLEMTELKPAGETMVSQIIATPYKLVAIRAANYRRVRVALDDVWKNALVDYRVSRGRFRTYGVLPSIGPEDFEVIGDIDVMRWEKLATFCFHIIESGRESGLIRGLSGTFTGIVDKETRLRINRVVPWGLMNLNSKSQANGFFIIQGDSLSLDFISDSLNSSEPLTGDGHIEAVRQTKSN